MKHSSPIFTAPLLNNKLLQFAVLVSFFSVSASAEVSLPAIFSEHAVLQKSTHTPVWGKADPGEEISVDMGAAKATTRANAEGKWRLDLKLDESGPGPFELSVQGKNKIVVSDVVVGEVWLASGQSNMELPLSSTAAAKEESASLDNSNLREFRVEKMASATPLDECKGRWFMAGPNTSLQFSAVGYYFGKRLSSDLRCPVGLIHSSWGGTTIEAWMSKSALAKDAELKSRTEALLGEWEKFPSLQEDYKKKYSDWVLKNNRTDHSCPDMKSFASVDTSTEGWKQVTLPGSLGHQGLPDSGVIWLRRKVTIPPTRANQYCPLLLGTLQDFDTVYWNGEKVGETTGESSSSYNRTTASTTDRRYDVPGQLVKAGDNTLAIRLFSPAGGAGVKASNFCAAWSLPLGGTWLAKAEYELSPLSAEAQAAYPKPPAIPPLPQYNASGLFNGMIHPLIPYAIRGALWYQGEANVARAFQYRTALKLLIDDWREQWKAGDFPFYLCQLANFQVKVAVPGDSAWAELRDAQTQALALPETGMAVLIDIGEQDEIHARNKKDVGERLALLALNRSYGKSDLSYSGPTYESAKQEGDKIRITFGNTNGGVVAKPLPESYQPKSAFPETVPLVRNSPKSELEGFAICGEDRKWKWANATIDGSTVLVWSDEVPHPLEVRYAWGDNPTCNLYNGASLPAAPFRTDNFPLITEKSRY